MIDFDVQCLAKLNLAMQQNGVLLFQRLVIQHDGMEELRDLKLQISCKPDLFQFCETPISVIVPESSLVLADLRVNWDSERLRELSEAQIVQLQIRLVQGEHLLKEEYLDVDVLPWDFWPGYAILPEMLAAFVTPNAPEIAPLLQRAAQLMLEWTGSAALDAYLSQSEDRARIQIAALYQAIREECIVYSLHPASFESCGQRVRLADKLIDTRLGTCLDMTLFYASCLEAIGLNALVVIRDEHTFVGAWLRDETLADYVSDDASLLRKRIAKGIKEMCFVESTLMNAGKDVSFEDASSSAEAQLLDDASFVCVLDVKRCRLIGVRPLSKGGQSRAVAKSFSAPLPLAPDALDLQRDKVEAQMRQSHVLGRQSIWERKLLDLSLRNNLLNMRPTRSVLPLVSSSINELEDLLAQGKEFSFRHRPEMYKLPEVENGAAAFTTMSPQDPISELIVHDMRNGCLHTVLSELDTERCLTHLYRSARLSLEENGANTLYLALGLLRWYEGPHSERARYAPLMLMPVEMKRRRGVSSGYTIRCSEEEIVINITLLELLKQDFTIDLSHLNELPRDAHGVDVNLIFNTLRQSLKDQPRWDVVEQAVLGVFSFSKFIMWNDIHNNVDKLRRSPVVDSLLQSQLQWSIPECEPLDIDAQLPPAELLLPVPADAYQIEAIYRAAKGESFVLHGPPGSGKSQTITNIIANALYRGKRVLFVAEKMAALSVVHHRLSQIGLNPFCLELHSNKATKLSVLTQLEEAANYGAVAKPAQFSREAERLGSLRKELRCHVDALHERQSMGISLYDALYRLDKDPPPAQTPYRPAAGVSLSLSAEEWTELSDALERLSSCTKLIGSAASHPLSLVGLSTYQSGIEDELARIFKEFDDCCKILQEKKALVEEMLAMTSCSSKPDDLHLILGWVSWITKQDFLTSGLLRQVNFESFEKRAVKLAAHGRSRDAKLGEIDRLLSRPALDLDATPLLRQWREAETLWLLPRWMKQRGIVRQLRTYAEGKDLQADDVPRLLRLIESTNEEIKAVAHHSDWAEENFAELSEDWGRMEEIAAVVKNWADADLGDIAKASQLRLALSDKLIEGQATFDRLYSADMEAYQQALSRFDEMKLTLCKRMKLSIALQLDYDLSDWCNLSHWFALHLKLLRDWCRWQLAADKLRDAGYGSYIDYLVLNEVPIGQIINQFNRGLYLDMKEELLRRDASLGEFNGQIFEDLLDKYRELELLNEKLSRQELAAQLGSRIPDFSREASQNSELGILQRCLRSRGRGVTIRRIFETLPQLMPRLKPCMLMSPMSVAQYIDAKQEPFDLLIFDEASQMPTCEAVGSIARAKSVVVVGDPKQMPPTSFFSTGSVDEEEMEMDDLESILDDCLALSMPSRYLRWHYRSRHESLIAFSNMEYYENKLLTYPSPDDLNSKLSFVPVKGFYDKGKSRRNVAEADAIVKEILRRLADPVLSRLSIGVISFSQVQQSLIEDLLLQALARPEYAVLEPIAFAGKEPIFIKNLENVQGDERDVILFSVGYGPDASGRVSMNFGPLNREGGWRRLNVAVSRARAEMQVFSSLAAEQIDLSRTRSQGVAGLRAFLEFAQKGKSALLYKSNSSRVEEPSMIDFISMQLMKRGYELRRHIGSSTYRIDMAVINPERPSEYLCAIITDGLGYHATSIVRDRELTQVSMLQSLGWNILRVWTLDWLQDSERVMNDLLRELEKLPRAIAQEASSMPTTKGVDNPVVVVAAAARPSRWRPYETAWIAAADCGGLDPLSAMFIPKMCMHIELILSKEAPMHQEALARRLMTIWGLRTLTSRVRRFFAEIYDRMDLCHRGDFLWVSIEQEQGWDCYRLEDERKAEHIVAQEYAYAALDLLQQQLAMPREDLQAGLIDLFDLGRKTEKLRSIVDAGIDYGMSHELFTEANGRCKFVD